MNFLENSKLIINIIKLIRFTYIIIMPINFPILLKIKIIIYIFI